MVRGTWLSLSCVAYGISSSSATSNIAQNMHAHKAEQYLFIYTFVTTHNVRHSLLHYCVVNQSVWCFYQSSQISFSVDCPVNWSSSASTFLHNWHHTYNFNCSPLLYWKSLLMYQILCGICVALFILKLIPHQFGPHSFNFCVNVCLFNNLPSSES